MPATVADAVVLTGGVAHDFAATTATVIEVLAEGGVTATAESDVDGALAALGTPSGAPRLVVLNLLRWTMQVERYADQRDTWSLVLSPAAQAGLLAHVESGGGLLALHGAPICFDAWPGWKDVLGARWVWGQSTHPPLDGAVRVAVATDAHPIVAGIEDFDVTDEVYGFLDRTADVLGLMTSAHGGVDHPLLWARHVGAGRVVYDALGHDTRSYEVPEHRLVLQRAALWACGALDSLADGAPRD